LLPFSILHFNNKILHSSSSVGEKRKHKKVGVKNTGRFGRRKKTRQLGKLLTPDDDA